MASAIVLPEPESRPSSSNGLKRRRSSVSEHVDSSKRPRTSPEINSPGAVSRAASGDVDNHPATESIEPTPASPPRRRRTGPAPDDKQRSKRLFGALLGNLNRPGGDRATKRRQEIEARRKAELERQDAERLETKQRRIAELAERRKRVKEEVELENMHARHRNMLHAANFLQTTTEPKLYYRPWDLRPDEEARIEEQLSDARERVDRELDELEDRRVDSTAGEMDVVRDSPKAKAMRNGNAIDAPAGDVVLIESGVNATAENHRHSPEADPPAPNAGVADEAAGSPIPPDQDTGDGAGHEESAANGDAPREEDMNDDVGQLVEGDEDTVIY